MLDHHIQRTIVYQLAFADEMRFSDLQPETLDNKLFDYHLKKVIKAGFVEKTTTGMYRLTAEGKRVGKGALKNDSRLLDRAYSVLFLAIRRKSDGSWLLYKRRTHPMIGLAGFMHIQPVSDSDILTTAQRDCLQKTGLQGDFEVKGHGYFRVYDDDTLESFTHFTLLACDDIQGELIEHDDLAEYFWQSDPDFGSPEMLPTMCSLAKLYKDDTLQFVDETVTI